MHLKAALKTIRFTLPFLRHAAGPLRIKLASARRLLPFHYHHTKLQLQTIADNLAHYRSAHQPQPNKSTTYYKSILQSYFQSKNKLADQTKTLASHLNQKQTRQSLTQSALKSALSQLALFY